ncbi:MAG: DUF4332 domain-containing protein [Acidobacteriota bacterium]
MNYRIDEIEGIGPKYAAKLKPAGIKNTKDFLKHCADRKGRKKVSGETGISEKLLLEWANMADLMRINGIGRQFAELLEAAGVDTVKELRNRKPANLAAKMAETREKTKVAKVAPPESKVEDWVQQAKSLTPMISH